MKEFQQLKELEKKIGYKFRNFDFLCKAVRHSSYTNEHRMKRIDSNERLEFLGDAVLELVSSEFLFHAYPEMPEGELTKLRASLVCEPTLAYCARQIDLGSYLFLGRGEDATGGRERESVVSDAMEATIGAIFLDGGFANAKEFILRFILDDIEHKKLFFDSKTILQEVIQGECEQDIRYEIIGEEGPDHDKCFTARVCVNDEVLGEGRGRTKKAAEQQAAYDALCKRKNK